VRFFYLGHSFGGATTLLTLSKDPRFKVGIVLDGWLFPLRDDEEVAKSVKQPLLFVNTGRSLILPLTQIWHHIHRRFLTYLDFSVLFRYLIIWSQDVYIDHRSNKVFRTIPNGGPRIVTIEADLGNTLCHTKSDNIDMITTTYDFY